MAGGVDLAGGRDCRDERLHDCRRGSVDAHFAPFRTTALRGSLDLADACRLTPAIHRSRHD